MKVSLPQWRKLVGYDAKCCNQERYVSFTFFIKKVFEQNNKSQGLFIFVWIF